MIDLSAALGQRVTFVAGNRKNAGKTTFLNCALTSLREHGPVAYLTIGVDGEKRDAIYGHAKPRVLAHRGDTLLTTQSALAETDGLYEIRHVFPHRTVLGRLALVTMRRGGTVELVGPEDNHQLAAIIQHIRRQEGIDTVLVDGAVNRLTQIAALPDAGYVYVAWVEQRALKLKKAVAEMQRLFALERVPQHSGPCPASCFEVRGALTPRKLRDLPPPDTHDTLLLEDFTKVFLTHRQIARLQQTYRLAFRHTLPLRFFVVNLFDVPRETFLKHIDAEQDTQDEQLVAKIVFNPYEKQKH